MMRTTNGSAPQTFFQDLLHRALNAGIWAAMWKMPLGTLLIVLALLIAVAAAFGLY